jgi:hypothetical protein
VKIVAAIYDLESSVVTLLDQRALCWAARRKGLRSSKVARDANGRLHGPAARSAWRIRFSRRSFQRLRLA